MNTYALITYSDGTFLIRGEYNNKDAAIIDYDNTHAALVNDKSCADCVIKLVDSQLNIVDNKYFDHITHEVTKKSTKKEN